jgi:hypothetical protein
MYSFGNKFGVPEDKLIFFYISNDLDNYLFDYITTAQTLFRFFEVLKEEHIEHFYNCYIRLRLNKSQKNNFYYCYHFFKRFESKTGLIYYKNIESMLNEKNRMILKLFTLKSLDSDTIFWFIRHSSYEQLVNYKSFCKLFLKKYKSYLLDVENSKNIRKKWKKIVSFFSKKIKLFFKLNP